jgi:hypothetical protein
MDGRVLTLRREQLERGGFVESALPRPGAFRLSDDRLLRLEGDNFTVLVPGPHSRHLLVRHETEEFRKVELPVALEAAPLPWGTDLLLPGEDGRAYLIDPRSGESRAEPFVPPFDRARPTHWRSPVRLDATAVALADQAGRIRRLVLHKDPRPRLVVEAERVLDQPLLADPISTGTAVVVVTADERVRSLAARDLSPVGAWPLEGALAQPPVAVNGRGFVAARSGKILAIGPDGQRLWSTPLRNGPTVGPPAVSDQAIWFLTQDGTLESRAPGDGAALERHALEILPAGGPRTWGSDLVIPVARGTLCLFRPTAPKATGGSPP